MIITKDLEGIVFNIFNYKENDLIVDVLCKQYGFMQLYVRGAQKTTAKSFYVFRLFNKITFDVSKLNLVELSTYKSGFVNQVFDYTKLDYEQMNSVMFIEELLIKIKHQQDISYQAYYQELELVIDKIRTNENSYFVINYFLYKTLGILGCAPILNCCSNCAKTSQIVAYDISKSGFVCQNCYDATTKNISEVKVLEYLYELNDKKEITNNQKIYDKIIFRLLIDILNDNAGIYLVATKYIY